MRSTAGSPAPRSRRVGNGSAKTFTPAAAAMRAAATRPGSRSARPPSRSADWPRPRSASAASETAFSEAAGAGAAAGTAAGSAPSDHETSAGRISVATSPGGPWAAAIASAASEARAAVLCDVRTQRDTLRATVSMSDCSCASYWVW